MSKKKKQKVELDETTTFADMNVDGFRWYDPSKKSQDPTKKPLQLTRKERRAIIRAGFLSVMPIIGIVAVVFMMMYLLARIWLG